MSSNSRKGYAGEHPVELILAQRYGPGVFRPRAGARRDVGDLRGVPLVISCKNRQVLEIAQWVDELGPMVEAAGLETGVVWHKRRGQASPLRWYVTTSGELFLPLLDAYAEIFHRERASVVSPRKVAHRLPDKQ